MEILPISYTYCQGNFYAVKSANWLTNDSLSGTRLFFLSYLNPTNGSVFIQRKENNVTSISSGTNITVIVDFILVQVELNGLQVSPTTYATTIKTKINFIKKPLVAIVNMWAFNNSIITDMKVPFIEPMFSLISNKSYDPDNTTAVLIHNWTCPAQFANQTYCNSFINAKQSQNWSMPLFTKFNLQLFFDKPYFFTLTLTSKDNPLTVPFSYTFAITFASPTKDDFNNRSPYVRGTSCEAFLVNNDDNVIKISDTLEKVVRFNMNTFTSIGISASFFNDRTPSAC